MFETAPGVRSQMQDKRVILVWNIAAHNFNFGGDYLLHILAHPLRIVIAFPINDDAMRHTFDVECYGFEIADFKGRDKTWTVAGALIKPSRYIRSAALFQNA